MRCDDMRDRLDDLWEGEETAEVREHLTQCASCARYRRDLRLVRAGLLLWRREEAPAPSLGFADRLVRQLGEMSKAPSLADFFERVGRRFVYATLVVTFLALLAMAVPSTGPVRGLTAADIQMPRRKPRWRTAIPWESWGCKNLRISGRWKLLGRMLRMR